MSWFIPGLLLAAFAGGLGVGWFDAHYTVATECEKLGRFYVGERVFECRRVSAGGEG